MSVRFPAPKLIVQIMDGAFPRTRHPWFYGNTVKLVALVADPPAVFTCILPVLAPVGTVAVICVSESTVKVMAFTPPNDTLVAPVKLVPVITTAVPT